MDDTSDRVGRRPFEAVTRRRLLWSTETATAAGLAGCLGDDGDDDEECVDEPDDEDPDEWDDLPEWEREANERIREHRTSTVEVVVRDGDDPVATAPVAVSMQDHEYGFGTAIKAGYFVEDTEDGDEYRERLDELFNTAVLENAHKWGPWEETETREQADETVEWLVDRGFDVRGHTCIWQTTDFGYYQYPDDVVEAIEEEDAEYLEERSIEHVETIVDHYRDDVVEWDVVNEQLDHFGMTDIIDPDEPNYQHPMLLEWFEAAREADPDATLSLNEYDIINGLVTGKETEYAEMAEWLLENGADVGGIGMQGHHLGSLVQESEDVLEVCETLAAVGDIELAVTEYDTPNKDEAVAADYLYEFLKTFFSHPATAKFLMWGFWDELHWAEDAPLFREDWSEKEAYDVYTTLVFDEWWTEESGETDCDGTYATRAFLGEHVIEVETGGETITETIRVTDPDEPTVVEVDPDGTVDVSAGE